MLWRLRQTVLRHPTPYRGAHTVGLRGPGYGRGRDHLFRTRGLRGGEPPGSAGVGRRRRLRPDGLRASARALEVHPERMWASLESGFSQATDLAEFVMQTCGVDYRTAYVVVGAAVRRAAAEGFRGIDLTAEMIAESAPSRIGRRLGLAGTDLTQVPDPRAVVGARRSPRGAA